MESPKISAISAVVVWASLTSSLGFTAVPSLYQIPVKTIDGKSATLEPYRGQVLLVVNTASQCGYTPQYEGIESLYEKYRAQGLVVLGFPSNDFGGQEPGSNAQIKLFCKGTYHVTFPMFEKNSVGGPKIQPLFSTLIQQSVDPTAIEWNFEKFLIGRTGKVLKRFKSAVTPDSPELIQSIELALKARTGDRK